MEVRHALSQRSADQLARRLELARPLTVPRAKRPRRHTHTGCP
jgi:hypothetical protein